MTATRIAVAATLTLAWVAAAALLWRASGPGLDVRPVDAEAVFGARAVEAAKEYQWFFRATWALSVVAQLLAVAWLARRRPLGRALWVPRAAALGVLVYAAAWAARLPFALAEQWWRRRHGVSEQDYASWLAGTWSTTLGELALAALAAALLVALARRLRRSWPVAAWAALVALAAAYVLAYPYLLAPRLRPLDDRTLAADIRALGADEVVVRKARERTRAVNAEAIGVGPSTRVVLWDTLLDAPRDEVLFVAAHEIAHVERRHAWQGVAWFALLAVPAALALSRVPLRDPAAVPRAALVVLVASLAALPAANAVSRRYEAEADRVALERTRDPRAAEALFRRFVRVNLSDPDPPRLAHLLLGTHPTLVERAAVARRPARGGP